MSRIQPGRSTGAAESIRPDSVVLPELSAVYDVAGRPRGMHILTPQQAANSVDVVESASRQRDDQLYSANWEEPALSSQSDVLGKFPSSVANGKRVSTMEPRSHAHTSSAWSIDSQDTWWGCVKSSLTCCFGRRKK